MTSSKAALRVRETTRGARQIPEKVENFTMKTIERVVVTLMAATALMTPASAQTAERQATLTGGGDKSSGKCTIEVSVDGTADVEVRGDRGFLRTLSGQPAQWRRFECSAPMPANPADVRFSGVGGRGRQELVQDPRGGPGVAVVRISDRAGGAKGYTFDLEWRDIVSGSGPGPTPMRGAFGGQAPVDSVRNCEDAVRSRALQQYGLRDVSFRRTNDEDHPGRNERIMGSFDARRGNSRDLYAFACSLNRANGRVRDVDISQGQNSTSAVQYTGGNDAASACQRAAELQFHRDGYRDVHFGLLDLASRNGRLDGTAVARRGDTGRPYDFNIRCAVDLANGNIRSVQAVRR